VHAKVKIRQMPLALEDEIQRKGKGAIEQQGTEMSLILK